MLFLRGVFFSTQDILHHVCRVVRIVMCHAVCLLRQKARHDYILRVSSRNSVHGSVYIYALK